MVNNGDGASHHAGGDRMMNAFWAIVDSYRVKLTTMWRKFDELPDKLDGLRVEAKRKQLEDGGGAKDNAHGQPIIRPVLEK